MAGVSRSWKVVLSVIAVATTPTAAPAVCPQVACDCVGQAAQYDIVAADKVKVSPTTFRDEGSLVHGGNSLGALCTTSGALKGTWQGLGDGTTSVGTLVAIAGPGSEAVRASSVGQGFGYAVGVNLLATGGGTFTGEADVTELDTSGTHAQVSTCTQAMADVQAGSQTLAALSPTVEYGDIVLTGDEELDIDAGPGTTVIHANKIVLRSSFAFDGVQLRINTVPETESMIINTERLAVGPIASIIGGGGKTIINVAGPGPSVRYNLHARVDVPVVAPERTLKIAGTFFNLAAVYARRVLLSGGTITGGCP